MEWLAEGGAFGFFGRGFWIDRPIAFSARLAFAAPDNPLARRASLCPATRLSARRPRCGGRLNAELRGHPLGRLAARPQPALGRRRAQAITQLRQKLRFQERRGRAVAPPQIAESLGPLGIVTGEQLFDPALATGRRRRPLRDGGAPRQQPDRLEMPRRRGVPTGHISLFHSSTLKCAQTVAMGPPPDS